MGIGTQLRKARRAIENSYDIVESQKDYITISSIPNGFSILNHVEEILTKRNILPKEDQREMIETFMAFFNPTEEFAVELRRLCLEAQGGNNFENFWVSLLPEFVPEKTEAPNRAIELRREKISIGWMALLGHFVLLIDETRHNEKAKKYLLRLYEKEFLCFLPFHDMLIQSLTVIGEFASFVTCRKTEHKMDNALKKLVFFKESFYNGDFDNNNWKRLLNTDNNSNN